MILTCLEVLTLIVLTVNVPEVAPASRFTQLGMLAGTLLFERAVCPHGAMRRVLPNPRCTVTPPAGAGWLSFTFPLFESPPNTPASLIVTVSVTVPVPAPVPRARAQGVLCATSSAKIAADAHRNMPNDQRSIFRWCIIQPPFSFSRCGIFFSACSTISANQNLTATPTSLSAPALRRCPQSTECEIRARYTPETSRTATAQKLPGQIASPAAKRR